MENQRKTLLQSGAWFYLFNTLLACLIAFRFLKYIDFGGSFLTMFYIFITTLSHFTLLTFIIFVALFLPWALIFPRKKFVLPLAIVGASVGILVLILDTFVFDLYRYHINLFTLELIFGGAASQIFDFNILLYIISIVFILILVTFEIFVARWFFKPEKMQKLRFGKLIPVVLLVFMLGSHIIHAGASALYFKPILKTSQFFPLYYPLNANNFLNKYGIIKTDDNRQYLFNADNEENKNLNYPRKPIETDSTVTQKNILFIVIDSWNYRALDKNTSPNIAAFADSSIVFTNHNSGSNGTRGGIFSLFYAIPAIYWYDMEAAQQSPVFIDYLLNQKYQTGIFASASLKSPPFERTVFSKIKNLRLETPGKETPDRDIQITKDWINFTSSYIKQNQKNPFFGFVFYDCPHNFTLPDSFKRPFHPTWEYANYLKLDNNTDPTPFFNLYRNCVYFDDILIGQILNDLKSKDLLKNTIVVITGDHSQEFNENKMNYWGHNGNFSRAQIGIPLVIHWPGKEKREYHQYTTHYDIVPTLMTDALGCKNDPSDYSIGRSLFDTTELKWHIAGSKDNFGIIEHNRITTINYNSSIDITDLHMHEIKGSRIDPKLFNEIMKKTNSFYR